MGVWDAHANDWHGDWTLTEPDANRQAHDLDVQYDFYAERKPSDVRRRRRAAAGGAVRVAARRRLDVWVRDDGKWWGRVRDNETDLFKWYPADQLQPGRSDQHPPPRRP